MRGAWAILVWVATLLLIAQPAIAGGFGVSVAGETLRIEICTSHGATSQTVELPGQPAKAADCEKCPHCLSAPVPLATETRLAVPGVFAYAAIAFSGRPAPAILGARAPPRPPGQGPPASNA